jgi:hypothetical protein
MILSPAKINAICRYVPRHDRKLRTRAVDAAWALLKIAAPIIREATSTFKIIMPAGATGRVGPRHRRIFTHANSKERARTRIVALPPFQFNELPSALPEPKKYRARYCVKESSG